MAKEGGYIKRQVLFLRPYLEKYGSKEKWIGFRSTSIDGKQKKFLYWTNFADSLDQIRAACGAILLELDAEAQIGPAIDLKKSLATGTVHVVSHDDKGDQLYGIYVEAGRRTGFNFFVNIRGLESLKFAKK